MGLSACVENWYIGRSRLSSNYASLVYWLILLAFTQKNGDRNLGGALEFIVNIGIQCSMPLTKVKGLLGDCVNELYETGEYTEEMIIDSLIEIAHEFVAKRVSKMREELEELHNK